MGKVAADPGDGWLDRERMPFAAALAHCRSGAFREGYAICQDILAREPDDIDALHLSGLIMCQAGHVEVGVERLRRAMALNDRIPVLHYNLAEAFRGAGHLGEAAAHYEVALRLAPGFADAQAALGNCLLRQNQVAEAVMALREAIALDPGKAGAHDNLGSALQIQGELEAADAAFRQAIALDPGYVEALYNRGNTLLMLGRHEEAVASFDRALALQPGLAAASHNRGAALLSLGRFEEALASFERTLQLTPRDARALSNRGNALQSLSRLTEAVVSYDRALAINLNFAEATYHRANALAALGRREEALQGYERALALQPNLADALYDHGNTLLDLDRAEEAAADFTRLLSLNPDHAHARGALHYARLLCCDWTGYAQEAEDIAAGIEVGKRSSPPFAALHLPLSPNMQRTCAKLYGRDRYPPAAQPAWRGEVYSHDRIRVAYLSVDFRTPAVADPLTEIWERHDRSRFEPMAVSFGPGPGEAFDERLKASFDRCFDARGRGDREIAAMLKAWQVDIAVDLMGHARSSRPGIFAFRPAPIQVNYLGYPGTMAVDYIDYILADRTVIPEDEQAFYSEKVVYLPDTILSTDTTRQPAERTPTRAEAGLPETGFVFCAFAETHKITPLIFDIWLGLLRQVEGSVLWLFAGSAVAVHNRRIYASERGVDPHRLIFASHVAAPEDLARYRLAGLFLDTLPYNASATASDALRVGLPLVTCAGCGFVGRVAASQLRAAGLPELITENLADYEALALRLAREPAALAAIKAKLAANVAMYKPFDMTRYTRHLESAYVTMWQRYQRGEFAAAFAVSPLPRP